MPLNPWFAAITLAALLASAGCSRTQDEPAASAPSAAPSGEAAGPDAGSVDATWQGVLPCSDCDGIQTRLRLLADGQGRRFELQETYLAQDGGEAFEGQGEWVEENAVIDGAPTVVYRLDINGASRWFSLKPDGALEMLDARERTTADRIAHRLQRM